MPMKTGINENLSQRLVREDEIYAAYLMDQFGNKTLHLIRIQTILIMR